MVEKKLEIGKTLLDVGISMFRKMFTDKFHSAETGEKLKEFEHERSGIFWEAWESILAHKFPTLSKLMDIASFVGLKEADPEEYMFQNEFEFLTAFAGLLPDSWIPNWVTQLCDQKWFQFLLDWYPFDGEIRERIKKREPKAVIDFIRMVHQDIVSGELTLQKIVGMK